MKSQENIWSAHYGENKFVSLFNICLISQLIYFQCIFLPNFLVDFGYKHGCFGRGKGKSLFIPFYLSDEEKRMVEEVFNNAIDCLSDEDKKLPQVSA